MSSLTLPSVAVPANTLPPTTGRDLWQEQLNALLIREKAHTHEGDAIAAARRCLPMVEIPETATVVGDDGDIKIIDVFEGRRMLVAYFHMWHDGKPWPEQCEGCTFCASQIQQPEYLHSRDITLAIFSQGEYAESRPYADFLGYVTPWYSARNSPDLIGGRDFGFYAFYVRDDEGNVFETYWSTGRGCEAGLWSYGLMDMTVFGRQEHWEDSPHDWPRIPQSQHPWRIDGRPTAQWGVTDGPAAAGGNDQMPATESREHIDE